MRWNPISISSVLVVVLAASSGAAAADGLTKVRSIEGITEYRMDNGLKVLLFPDDSKPKVTVNLTIFVGSRHEGYGETGMAHLLEHMLFKGTPTHQNVPKALTARGARFNGTTWVDRTNYYESLPAGDDNLKFAIALEADRMVNSYVKKEDLVSEMTVVRNEFERGENLPRYILDQRMMAVAFEWHNYGKSTIGNRADIERVPIERLQVFYRKFYQPDNAMLIVAGRFNKKIALATISKHFGAIPRPTRALEATYTEEPTQDGERFVSLRREGSVAVAGVVYHISAGPHPEFASLKVLENIMTSKPSGRLFKSLVETKKASSLQGSAYAFHDPGVLQVLAEVTQGNVPQDVLTTMIDSFDTVMEKGVTPEEVERAKRKLLKKRELKAADSGKLAIELSEWASQGDWRLYFLHRDRIEKVTAESVARVAKKYLKRSNRTVGLFIPTKNPERSIIPGTPELAKMIGEYKGRALAARGEAFDVSPAYIEKRTTRSQLSSGTQVALLPKKTRQEAVYLRLTLCFGNQQDLRNLTTPAEALPHLMSRGTKSHTRQQLQDALDVQSAKLQVAGTVESSTFAIQTKRKNLPAVLELLRQVLREPSFSEKELEIFKQEKIAKLQKHSTTPASLAQRKVRRTMYPYSKGDPRYIPTFEEEIEMVRALSVSTVRKLHEQYLGAQFGQLTIVGDFDAGQTLKIADSMLAGWKAKENYTRLEHLVNPNVVGADERILTPGKASAVYFASMAIPLSDASPDYPAMVIGNFVLGGGSLSSRLADRIRQTEGLSYRVMSGFQARSLDPRSAFYMYASFKPTVALQLKTAMKDELERLLADGITSEELRNAQKGYLQRQEILRTSDDRLARTLEKTLVAKRTMQFYADLDQHIQSLTTDQVHAALRKHLDPKKLVVVTAGDFENASANTNKNRTADKPSK